MIAAAGVLGDLEHPAVDVGGHAGDHRASAASPSRCRPVRADQVVVAADAAGGDDRRPGRASSKSPTVVAGRSRGRARRRSGASTVPRTPVDGAAGRRPARRPGAGTRNVTRPVGYGLDAPGARTARRRPGPVPQVRWKRGTELPCPSARPSPRSAQPDDREDPAAPCACSHARFSPAAKSTYASAHRRGQWSSLAVELARCPASPATRARRSP